MHLNMNILYQNGVKKGQAKLYGQKLVAMWENGLTHQIMIKEEEKYHYLMEKTKKWLD